MVKCGILQNDFNAAEAPAPGQATKYEVREEARMERVTLKQISEMTGYSQATVSNVLNRKKEVSAETEKIIRMAAEQLGYRSTLKLEKITLVMYRKSGEVLLETPLILSLMEGVEKEGQKHHIKTLIYNLDKKDIGFESRLRSLINEKKSAIILLATELSWEDIAIFKRLSVPFVVVDAWFKEGNFPTILMDNRSSFEKSVEYLVKKGHTKIGYIGSTVTIKNFEERETGFRKAMLERGLHVEEKYCVRLDPCMNVAQESMKRYLSTAPELPTAYVAVNDIIAAGAMKALENSGYRVPEDVSIIGFDNMPLGEMLTPALTTFNVLKEEIGRLAVRVLIQQATGEYLPTKIEVLTELVERSSVKDISGGN